jgi:hypothetical protein
MNAQIEGVQLRSWSFRSTLVIVIWAGIGGILPTLAKLAAFYVNLPKEPLPDPGLYLGLSLFFILGAAVALVSKVTDFRKAIVVGIAAPGVVSNIAAGNEQAEKAQPSQQEAPEQTAMLEAWPLILGIGTARAQTPPPQAVQLTVVPAPTDSEVNYAASPVRIQFLSRDGRVLTSTTVDPRTTTPLSVPQGAASVRAEAGGRWGDTALPRGPYASADLRLKVEFGRPNDFLWALGQTRKARIDGVDVSVANVKRANAPIDRGTVVLSTDGTQLGVVDSVRRAPGRPQAVVVEPDA